MESNRERNYGPTGPTKVIYMMLRYFYCIKFSIKNELESIKSTPMEEPRVQTRNLVRNVKKKDNIISTEKNIILNR